MQGMGDDSIKVRRIKEDNYKENSAPAYGDNEYTTRTQNLHNIQEFEELEVTAEGVNSDWGSIYKNIRDTLDGKDELLVKPEQVLYCMRVIEAAFISSAENRVVTLD